jgi:hypothetical protein
VCVEYLILVDEDGLAPDDAFSDAHEIHLVHDFFLLSEKHCRQVVAFDLLSLHQRRDVQVSLR